MSQARFETVFAGLMLPACVIDPEGKVVAWNTAMADLCDVAESDALGKPMAGLGDLPTALHRHLVNIVQLQSANRSNIRVLDHVYVVCSIPLPESEWALTIEPTLDAVTDQQTMMYTVIHDLQNPLAAIKGFAELAANVGQLNEKQTHFLNKAQNAVHEMSDLVSGLLDLAWIDAGMEMQLKPINLAFLTNELSSGHSHRAQKRNVTLKLDIERVPPVLGDERRIKRVINNLINNAIKYSINGGEVVISVQPIDDRVQVAISDQGIGIPVEYQDKIFKRFFRVPGKSTENIEGNGLGLAICYEILERHGAVLKVESDIGQGSRFYFSLPIVRES